MRVRRLALALLIGLAAWPTAAQADDASVFAAWGSHTPELKAANDAYSAAWRDYRRGGRPTRAEYEALIGANDQISGVMAQIGAEVAAQSPSTEGGAKARRLTLKEIDLAALSNRYENNGYRAALSGHPRAARRWLRRSDRAFTRYGRARLQTRRAWEQLGFKYEASR